jgi:hypothetical protein
MIKVILRYTTAGGFVLEQNIDVADDIIVDDFRAYIEAYDADEGLSHQIIELKKQNAEMAEMIIFLKNKKLESNYQALEEENWELKKHCNDLKDRFQDLSLSFDTKMELMRKNIESKYSKYQPIIKTIEAYIESEIELINDCR